MLTEISLVKGIEVRKWEICLTTDATVQTKLRRNRATANSPVSAKFLRRVQTPPPKDIPNASAFLLVLFLSLRKSFARHPISSLIENLLCAFVPRIAIFF